MMMTQLVNEFLCSANMAFAMYPGLTQGAIAALIAHGSPEQKARYLPKMVAGEWTGTMNLTEPHCGTDLGLLRTKAVKQPDGSYKITGTKIFISAGEHDLAGQHHPSRAGAHRRRARRHRAAFRCSSCRSSCRRPTARSARATRVSCGSLEEKMGIHGNATCVMNYDGATGWLLGEENRGLHAMFTMMNEARLGVGVQGLALSEVAYQNAVDLRQGAAAGPRADRRQGQGQAGRSDHRASRRAPHADDDQVVQRGGARAGDVDRARLRSAPPLARTTRPGRPPTTTWACSRR